METLGKGQKYDGSSSTDPLHRKLRYLSFVNKKRADVKLAKSGSDPVLIIGNWTPGITRFHEPIRGKGLREMLISQGFIVYLIDKYCTSTFCPACESRMDKFHKTDDPCLKNPKHKYHVAMEAATTASDFVTAATNSAGNSVAAAAAAVSIAEAPSSNCVAVATTSTAASIAAAATAVSVAIKTAAVAASTIKSEQQSRDKWMPIRPQSADIIRWIGEEKGWSEDKIDSKIKQQVQDEKAERNWEQYSNVQPADNLKRIVRLSGWSRGKVKRKIRQRIRDELAAQEQQVTATGVNTIPAVEKTRQIL
ncbi:hypothetical protein LPJ66_001093 [Kickxella alabastrina]|uniref:Uncharacterized protein n=1 Tax=Kickxella alabastrina TaxID=61397 RepID=A0ACC1IU92_9FUNG|nr:hypothetical protein LPJ66_001093 [Kickxella alabastrina]